VPSWEPLELTARVTFVGRVNQWTKAGIMLRRHLGPQSPHASLFVTPTTVKGIAFQRRRTDGGLSVHTSGPAITAPVWLKLVLNGTQVRAYYRTDGGSWTFVGEDTIPFNQFGTFGGLAVSSHVDSRLAEAVFDNVSVRRLTAWSEQDIGDVRLTGSGSTDGLRVTVEGAGADIWGTADAFRFRHTFTNQTNVQVSARVLSVENTNQWAKAGVMFRDYLEPGARHVMLIVSPGRGVAMQYRASRDGITANAAIVPGAAPKWLRLRRTGDLFVGEMSDDGAAWTEVGRVTLAANAMYEGLAVTSHNNRALATAVFEDVAVEPLPGGP
jgi:regulation of enolase protein 1 (concanavalin A-like superfamily)